MGKITEEVVAKEIIRCYKQFKLGLKRKNVTGTKYWEGRLDSYEDIFKKIGGDPSIMDDEKEKIDELLGT